jgi:hypothetical protein
MPAYGRPHLKSNTFICSHRTALFEVPWMRRVGAAFAILLVALGAVRANAQQNTLQDRTEAFFKGLACRNAQVLGGQNNIGAILYHDPAEKPPNERDRYGNLIYTLDRRAQPLGLFRIDRPDARNRQTARVDVVFDSNSSVLAVFDRLKRSHETRFFWTTSDDLVIWNRDELWFVDGRPIRAGLPFLFERMPPERIPAIEQQRTDAIPEHIRSVARLVGGDLYLTEFDPRSRSVSDSPVHPGPFMISGEDQVGWTQSDVFVRLIKMTTAPPRHLEIGPPEGRHPWGWFAPLTFPNKTRLLLARDNSELKIPEALLLWRNERSVSDIALVRLGSTKPTIVAADYIKKVFWYPDRSKLYGYTDHTGQFHPLPSERHSSAVLFWLAQFERMEGIEEFYLLDSARYAVVKRNGAATGAEAIILERRGPTVATLEQLCHTSSAVQRVVEGPHSLLFTPKEPVGETLAVYMHDGPFTSVGRGGDWITDVIVRTGTPVLAINYFGSSSRLPELAVSGQIAPLFAADVEEAIAFARGKLSGQRKLIFVGQGFGSFAGFASMMADAARPEAFIILSGFTDPRHLFKEHVPNRDPFELNYLARAGRQLGAVMNPTAASKTGTRFLFVHGTGDDKAPFADVGPFLDRLNATATSPRAELKAIEGMGHLPETKAHYRAVIDAVENLLHDR